MRRLLDVTCYEYSTKPSLRHFSMNLTRVAQQPYFARVETGTATIFGKSGDWHSNHNMTFQMAVRGEFKLARLVFLENQSKCYELRKLDRPLTLTWAL